MQLELRHNIRSDILIYPGYVPQPGVKYRVFHYGLEFKVGNWSFDKANWRTTDIVNTCWAKFPDPPDISSIDSPDENSRRRDALSIECGSMLNEALWLHHERSNCSTQNTKVHEETKRFPSIPNIWHWSGLRFWLIVLWAFSVLAFLAFISIVLSSRKGNKAYRKKIKP